MKLVSRLVSVFALAAPALAQGTDTCTTPTAISGGGPFAFDNTAATTGSEGQPVCGVTCGRDVWFAWTAPTTGTYVVSTCGGASFDSVVAVYAGSACPGAAALGCNDDSCGLQSNAAFSATAGATYVVQLGSYNTSAGGTGTFTIAVSAPCGTNTGPDVIVGDITGPSNYSPAGALDAISLGTVSCNLGDTWLNWIASTNQHPVIGGNLYRWRVQSGSGRFEQIGQSWLKHGFYALSQNLCCSTCIGTDGTHLGVGCSDPYTSARNGSQSGLGPRWQVNPSTGAFTYPPANPAYSGSTARRLEFLIADVDTTAGVRYFGEAQYVSPDDALAGNNNNNASYREMTTTGTSFSFSGPTQRERSAIEAWAVCESGVSLSPVQIAGDGLFQVAYKVTDLGAGLWHYEYAIHNLNSHRGGGSFSVPVGTAAVTNVGFHDVSYRNGDGSGSANVAETDWAVTHAGGVLTWSTEDEHLNPNANALRWGTTYNFRFDADVAPASGTGSLGLWRDGTQGYAAVPIDVPGSAGATSTAFCFGDGTGAACPCGNNGLAGNGCASSVNANGASLARSGTASVSADTFALAGSGMPDSPCLYFQGGYQEGGGNGIAFGDGLKCAGGFLARLGTKTNAGGASQYPGPGDPAISVRGLCYPGAVRTYQCWYRNEASFCSAATFNLTNGRQETWLP